MGNGTIVDYGHKLQFHFKSKQCNLQRMVEGTIESIIIDSSDHFFSRFRTGLLPVSVYHDNKTLLSRINFSSCHRYTCDGPIITNGKQISASWHYYNNIQDKPICVFSIYTDSSFQRFFIEIFLFNKNIIFPTNVVPSNQI